MVKRRCTSTVKPTGRAMVLELMHFADELADPKQLALPDVESGKKELAIAESLVEAMTEKWDPKKYHDEYAEGLMKVIEEKVAAGGKELPPVKRVKAPSTKIVDIVAMLQQSLNQTKKAEPKKKSRKAA